MSNIIGAMNKINNRIKSTLQQQNYDPSQPSETTATMRVCVRACVNVCVCVVGGGGGGGVAGWRLEWGGEGGIHSLPKQFVIITDSRRHVKFITLAAETFFRSHQTD